MPQHDLARSCFILKKIWIKNRRWEQWQAMWCQAGAELSRIYCGKLRTPPPVVVAPAANEEFNLPIQAKKKTLSAGSSVPAPWFKIRITLCVRYFLVFSLKYCFTLPLKCISLNMNFGLYELDRIFLSMDYFYFSSTRCLDRLCRTRFDNWVAS